MNIDLIKQNNTTTKYLDMLMSNGMQCMIKESMREDVNKKTSSCIDHMFIKDNSVNTQFYSSIITTTISDHYSLFLCVNKTELNQEKEIHNTQGPQLNNFLVNKKLNNVKWNDLINSNEHVNDIYNKIYEKFSEIYKSSYKTNKIIKKRSANPWINDELIKQCEIRDDLFKKYKNCKNKNTSLEREYKQFRNRLNKKIIFARNNYYRSKFIENRGDIRATWQIINEIIGKKN